jgi:hypothetical protein
MTRANKKCSPRFIAERLTIMLDSFPHGLPNKPEVYMRALFMAVIEHDPSTMVLEAACRHIVRNSIFRPAVAEMLRTLREQEALEPAR